MKSAHLSRLAQLADSPFGPLQDKVDIREALHYIHDLECKVEMLKDQANAKNDLRAELAKKDLQIDAIKEIVNPSGLDKLESPGVRLDRIREILTGKRKDDGCARLSPADLGAGTLTCNLKFGHKGKHQTFWADHNWDWD